MNLIWESMAWSSINKAISYHCIKEAPAGLAAETSKQGSWASVPEWNHCSNCVGASTSTSESFQMVWLTTGVYMVTDWHQRLSDFKGLSAKKNKQQYVQALINMDQSRETLGGVSGSIKTDICGLIANIAHKIVRLVFRNTSSQGLLARTGPPPRCHFSCTCDRISRYQRNYPGPCNPWTNQSLKG